MSRVNDISHGIIFALRAPSLAAVHQQSQAKPQPVLLTSDITPRRKKFWLKLVAYFTNLFLIAIVIRRKFRFALTSILSKRSLQNFAHDTTPVLSWHMERFVVSDGQWLHKNEAKFPSNWNSNSLVNWALRYIYKDLAQSTKFHIQHSIDTRMKNKLKKNNLKFQVKSLFRIIQTIHGIFFRHHFSDIDPNQLLAVF